MTDRICPACNWVYPRSYSGVRCRFCGALLDKVLCPDCGRLLPIHNKEHPTTLCKDCRLKRDKEGTKSARQKRWMERRVAASDKRFVDWCTTISKLPFIPMTEEAWLEACQHFNRCALCDNPEIVARGYFIPFSAGGRYTAWNIIPLCEECATDLKLQPNIFKRLDRRQNDSIRAYRGMNAEKLEEAVKYLQSRMEKIE